MLFLSLLSLAHAEDWKVGDLVGCFDVACTYDDQYEKITGSYVIGGTTYLYVEGSGYQTQADLMSNYWEKLLPVFYPDQTPPGWSSHVTAPVYASARDVSFSVQVTGLSLFATSVVWQVEDEPCGGGSPTYSAVWQSVTALTDLFSRTFSGAFEVPGGCSYYASKSANGSPSIVRYNYTDR